MFSTVYQQFCQLFLNIKVIKTCIFNQLTQDLIFSFYQPLWVDYAITLITSFNFFKNLLTILCACIWQGNPYYTCMCMQRSGDNSCESVLSCHLGVGSGVKLRLPGLCGKWFYLPSYLSGPDCWLTYSEISVYYGRVSDCHKWGWLQRPTLENRDFTVSLPPSFWSWGEW